MKTYLLIGLLLSPLVLFGQSAPSTQINASNDTGISPHTAYSLGVGNVNLTNGNLTLEIPLINIPGRAGNLLSRSIQYNSKVWVPHYVISGDGSTIVYTWQTEGHSNSLNYGQPGEMGWRLNDEWDDPGGWETDANGNQTGYMPHIVTLKDGSKHSIGENRFCCGQSLDAEDDSALGIETYTPSILAVRTMNGDSKTFGASNDVDSNGNQYSPADTLGRSITTVNDPTYSGYPGSIQYQDSNGVTQTITLTYTSVALSPSFALPQASHGVYYVYVNQPPARQYVLLRSVTLPDNTQYTFTYNSYGELIQITLPTGGYAAYSYGVFTHRENYWWGPQLYENADFREVTSRQVCDGAGWCETTTYTPTINAALGQINNSTMDVVEASGTSNARLTRHTFTQASVSGEVCDKFYSPRETASNSYAGATATTQLLRSVATSYNSYSGGACSDLFLPSQVTTTLYDVSPSLVKQEQFDYDTYTAHVFYPFSVDPTAQTAQDVSVPIDRVIAHREYDWGSGAPGPLIRTTQTDWLKTSAYKVRTNHILNRKTRVAVLDSGGTKKSETKYEYDNYTEGISASNAVRHQTVGTSRGNLTAIDAWVDTTNTYLETRFQYDDAGNGTKAKDPIGNITLMSYADSWGNGTCTPTGGNAAAYLTSVTNASSQVTSAKYNSCAGTMAQVTDPNLQTTTYTYDFFRRLTDILYPDTGEIKLSYPNATTVQRQQKLTTAPLWITNYTYFDGLGRTKQTRLVDPEGDDYVDTTYDVLGRKATMSNPHRTAASSTDGVTAYVYDALDRPCVVVPPDGTPVTTGTCPATAPARDVFTTYSGKSTTAADEAGKKRTSTVDGLGRLIQVFEDPASVNYETDYTYNALDDLTCVEQHGGVAGTGCSSPRSSDASSPWRVRRFSYNSLSQLLTATNPESGQFSYTYDNDGNVITKTAPAPNQLSTGTVTATTTYTYDALNRLTGKSYSDSYNGNLTTSVAYGYDGANLTCTAPIAWTGAAAVNGIGRRTAMCDGTGSDSWRRDAMGRIVMDGKRYLNPVAPFNTNNVSTANGVSILGATTQYYYNLIGDLDNTFYPGNYFPFPPGEFYIVENGARRVTTAGDSANNVMTSGTYTPAGQLATANIGPYAVANTYNSRLQPSQLSVTNSAKASLLSLSYDFHLGNGDNGNVYQITNGRDNNRSQHFDYDNLNRIKDAYTTGSNWGETYTVDAWSNLWQRSSYAGKSTYEPLSCPAGLNNQLTTCSFTYDPAGNVTFDGNHHYKYDDENRVIQVDGGAWNYFYDGDGQREKKCSGTACSSGTFYWHTIDGGGTLAESDLGGNWTAAYGIIRGQITSRVDLPGATVHYYFHDHLGSTNVVADGSGNIQNDSDYYPYGGEIKYVQNDTNRYKFTGKERDSESGLDMFGARYYGSSLGRFMTPDWAAKPTAVPYAHYGNPQSLNLYSYVQNNPTTVGDPDGHVAGVDDAVIVTAAVVAYGALVTYYVLSQPQTQHALSDASRSAVSAISSLFHPDNSGKNVPPPPTVPTQNQQQGTPASTSQQGAVNTSPVESRSFSPGVKAGADANARGKCEYCGAQTVPGQKSQPGVTPPANERQTDHYEPSSQGGANTADNAVNACRSCNGAKSDTQPQGTKWELPRMKKPDGQ